MLRRTLPIVLAALVITPALAEDRIVSPTLERSGATAQAQSVYFPNRLDWQRKKPEEVGMNPALVTEAVQLAIAAETPDFAGTDAALSRLGLLPAAKLGRPAEARVAGAKRLFGFQILALVAQVLSVLVGASIALTWR